MVRQSAPRLTAQHSRCDLLAEPKLIRQRLARLTLSIDDHLSR
jgi:hypothetical protein